MIPQVTLDRKLWLNATKTKVVEDGDPEAAFLYGIRGNRVPRLEAERLGALPLDEVTKEVPVEVASEVVQKRVKPVNKPEGK